MTGRNSRQRRLFDAGVLVLALALLTASCSDDGDEAPEPMYGGVVKNQGTNPFGSALSSGDPVVDRLIDAARTCGFQSYNSVPASWKKVHLGDKGCAIWVPLDWVAAGEGSDRASSQDPDGETGVVSLRGSQAQGVGIVCTLKGVANWIFGNVEPYNRCTSTTELLFQEGFHEIDGRLFPKAVQIVTCVDSGITFLDYLSVTIQVEAPLCDILVTGFWIPEDKIEEQTCALSQILQSARCPKDGSFCDTGECDDDCKEMGHPGGSCAGGDDDRCHCEAP